MAWGTDPLAIFTGIFDANVFYSMPLTDIVMEAAAAGLFRARWSADIHDEWIRNATKNRSDLPEGFADRRRAQMDKVIPQALVTGYRDLIGSLILPDPNDRHW